MDRRSVQTGLAGGNSREEPQRRIRHHTCATEAEMRLGIIFAIVIIIAIVLVRRGRSKPG
jgi:hypothetical protein